MNQKKLFQQSERVSVKKKKMKTFSLVDKEFKDNEYIKIESSANNKFKNSKDNISYNYSNSNLENLLSKKEITEDDARLQRKRGAGSRRSPDDGEALSGEAVETSIESQKHLQQTGEEYDYGKIFEGRNTASNKDKLSRREIFSEQKESRNSAKLRSTRGKGASKLTRKARGANSNFFQRLSHKMKSGSIRNMFSTTKDCFTKREYKRGYSVENRQKSNMGQKAVGLDKKGALHRNVNMKKYLRPLSKNQKKGKTKATKRQWKLNAASGNTTKKINLQPLNPKNYELPKKLNYFVKSVPMSFEHKQRVSDRSQNETLKKGIHTVKTPRKVQGFFQKIKKQALNSNNPIKSENHNHLNQKKKMHQLLQLKNKAARSDFSSNEEGERNPKIFKTQKTIKNTRETLKTSKRQSTGLAKKTLERVTKPPALSKNALTKKLKEKHLYELDNDYMQRQMITKLKQKIQPTKEDKLIKSLPSINLDISKPHSPFHAMKNKLWPTYHILMKDEGQNRDNLKSTNRESIRKKSKMKTVEFTDLHSEYIPSFNHLPEQHLEFFENAGSNVGAFSIDKISGFDSFLNMNSLSNSHDVPARNRDSFEGNDVVYNHEDLAATQNDTFDQIHKNFSKKKLFS